MGGAIHLRVVRQNIIVPPQYCQPFGHPPEKSYESTLWVVRWYDFFKVGFKKIFRLGRDELNTDTFFWHHRTTF